MEKIKEMTVWNEPVSIDLDAIMILKKNAALYPFSTEKLLMLRDGKIPSPGDSETFKYVKDGLKVVLTVEEHPIGWCEHISFSYKNRCPPHLLVKKIAYLFGFQSNNIFHSWTERYKADDGEIIVEAINLLKRYPDLNEHIND